MLVYKQRWLTVILYIFNKSIIAAARYNDRPYVLKGDWKEMKTVSKGFFLHYSYKTVLMILLRNNDLKILLNCLSQCKSLPARQKWHGRKGVLTRRKQDRKRLVYKSPTCSSSLRLYFNGSKMTRLHMRAPSASYCHLQKLFCYLNIDYTASYYSIYQQCQVISATVIYFLFKLELNDNMYKTKLLA